jgi:hypothetical protein
LAHKVVHPTGNTDFWRNDVFSPAPPPGPGNKTFGADRTTQESGPTLAMIFVEPHSCWRDRQVEQRRLAEVETMRRNLARIHPIQDELLCIVREHGKPIRDVDLAKQFAKIPGYRNRAERDDWMKKAWQHMTALIRNGLLQWSAQRKHVEPAPPDKHRTWLLSKFEEMNAGLPKPRI